MVACVSPAELTQAVHDNLRNLGLDVLDVVNLRCMFDAHGPAEGSIEEPLSVLAELQQQGLVRHIGLSNVTSAQVAQGQKICEIVCVQNNYNLVHRDDDALIDELAGKGIAYVPFFRWVGSRRCSLRRCQKLRSRWEPRLCKWHLPGCCSVHPTFC